MPALAVVVLTLVAAGAAAGYAIRGGSAPDSLRPPDESAVTEQQWDLRVSQFFDARSVELQPTLSESQELVSGVSGIVTRLDCKSKVRSGGSRVAIDDRPLIFLATGRPLWRDLVEGSRGEDVELLQNELVRLGYAVTVDGRFGRQTLNALDNLYTAADYNPRLEPDGLQLGSVIWIASPTITSLNCAPNLSLGQRVTAGVPLFQTAAQLAAIEVRNRNLDLTEGSRELVIGDAAAIPLNDQLTGSNPDDLKAVESTEEYQAWFGSDGDIPLMGSIQRRDPIPVAAVPPASVVTDNDAACIFGIDGRAFKVEIVASRAGQTLIEAPPDVPRSILSRPGEDLVCP